MPAILTYYTPSKHEVLKRIQQESNIVGKKATPPNRGMACLCIFRSFGTSNNFLCNEIIKIRGIISRETPTEITKDIIINIKFIIG